MAADVTQVRIEMLRRRWELTLSPHVSLQLADLYRQTSRLGEAIAVLERGLEGNPASVSLRVALGRYRMENGDAQGATVALKEVVDRDPSHLVANKLLVKSYLAQGELQRARDRLDLYVLLNDSDPEIEALERSVASGRPVEAPRPAPPPPAEPFDLPAPATTVDLASLVPPPPRAPSAPPAVPGRRIWFASGREPFPGLGGRLGDPDDWSALLAGGIFRRPAVREAVRVNGSGPAVGAPAPEPALEALPAPPAPAPAPAPEPEVSATLGRLYLEQGHLEEAEAIFSAVLAHSPEHEEARAGMFEIAARRTLAAPAPVPTAPADSSPIVRRKIEILQGYLGRLHRAREREGSRS
jgi:tetratricopeptide (TPR) repeat protein